jgi:hypothetical protein
MAGGTVLGQALAVFQAFSLTKLRIAKLLSQKLEFWESFYFEEKNSPQRRESRRRKEKKRFCTGASSTFSFLVTAIAVSP